MRQIRVQTDQQMDSSVKLSHIMFILKIILSSIRKCLQALMVKKHCPLLQHRYSPSIWVLSFSPVCSDWSAVPGLSRHHPPCVCITSAGVFATREMLGVCGRGRRLQVSEYEPREFVGGVSIVALCHGTYTAPL